MKSFMAQSAFQDGPPPSMTGICRNDLSQGDPQDSNEHHPDDPTGQWQDDLAMEDFDDSTDHREGVYDSSKKQRVPSWVSHILT